MQLTLLAIVYISKSYAMLFSSWKLSFTYSAHSHLKLHLFEETSWGLIAFLKKKNLKMFQTLETHLTFSVSCVKENY